jgi:hypothetical protein
MKCCFLFGSWENRKEKKKGTFIPLLIINLISFRTKTDSGFIYSFKVGVVTVRDAIQMAEDTELNLVYHSFYFIFIFFKLLWIYELYLYKDVVSLLMTTLHDIVWGKRFHFITINWFRLHCFLSSSSKSISIHV